MDGHRFHQTSELVPPPTAGAGSPHPSNGGLLSSTDRNDRAGKGQTVQDLGRLLPLPPPLQPSELRPKGSCGVTPRPWRGRGT